MLRPFVRGLLWAATAMPASLAAQNAQSAQELFQQALVAERSEGKLTEAIALYARVVRDAGGDRSLSARALVRLGAAYETLGRSEARAAYDRVLNDFGDQADEVAEARSRLAALDQLTAPGGARSTLSIARQVWMDEALGSLSDPSQDGHFLTFTDWTTGNLAIRDLRRDTTRRLTDKDSWDTSAEFSEMSVFSADGSRIAYAWFTQAGNYQLRTISVQGGEPHTVPLPDLYYVSVYDWTPAGDGILCVLQFTSGDAVLAIVKLDGALVRLAPINWRWTTGAGISRDGRWVVFDEAGADDARRDVHIVASDGTHASILVRHPSNDWRPFWTPDGGGVAFLSDRTGTPALWLVNVTNGVAHGDQRMLKADMGFNYPVGLSRDGTLFYSAGTPTTDVVVAEIDIDSLRIRGTPEPVMASFARQNSNPDWSPDGHSLAFLSLRGSMTGLPGERVLATLDLDTDQQREYQVPLALFLAPSWSADGRHIMLSGSARGDVDGRQYSFDLHTGEATPLTPKRPKWGMRSAWSPNERSVLYTRADSANRISLHRFTSASNDDAVLYSAQGPSEVMGLAASPDGQWIAITTAENMGTSQASTRTQLLAQADGRVIRNLSAGHPFGYVSLNWSPNNRYVIGVTPPEAGNGAAIWRVPVDGSPATRFDFRAAQINQLRLSRDGTRIAFVTGDRARGQTPSIWAVAHIVPPAPGSGSRPR